jgi:hypothetical protein
MLIQQFVSQKLNWPKLERQRWRKLHVKIWMFPVKCKEPRSICQATSCEFQLLSYRKINIYLLILQKSTRSMPLNATNRFKRLA